MCYTAKDKCHGLMAHKIILDILGSFLHSAFPALASQRLSLSGKPGGMGGGKEKLKGAKTELANATNLVGDSSKASWGVFPFFGDEVLLGCRHRTNK